VLLAGAAATGLGLPGRLLNCQYRPYCLFHPCRHIAAEAGDLQMMRLLMERGAALDVRDAAGSTPLHLALEAQVN
jgi:hypothetical protein